MDEDSISTAAMAALDTLRDKRERRQCELIDCGAAEMITHALCALTSSANTPSMETIDRCLLFACALMNGGTRHAQIAFLNAFQNVQNGRAVQVLDELIKSCPAVELEPILRSNRSTSLFGGDGIDSDALKALEAQANYSIHLFRCIQLFCEGHYYDFQEFLRYQSASNIRRNILTSTTDYLLRLQEHLRELEILATQKPSPQIVQPAMEHAIDMMSQVLTTLTEMVQGPCRLNQNALVDSRLCDVLPPLFAFFAKSLKV